MRLLKAEEIELRIGQVSKWRNGEVGAMLLLYKDARCDMNILDETYGTLGWERRHEVKDGQLFCTVRVYDQERNQWISKEDVGVESNTEKEKGRASDSFKRACVNLGIGRELYTAPNVLFQLNKDEVVERNGKVTTYSKFSVKDIEYDINRRISYLEVVDAKGNLRYTYGESRRKEYLGSIAKMIEQNKITAEEVTQIIVDKFNREKSTQLNTEELKELAGIVKTRTR